MSRYRLRAAAAAVFAMIFMPGYSVSGHEEEEKKAVSSADQNVTEAEEQAETSDESAGAEENRKGEILVRLLEETERTGKEGIVFFCAKAASMENGKYILTEEYQDSGADLNEIQHAEDLNLVIEQLSACEVTGMSGTTDQAGEVRFQNLAPGAYLVWAEEDSDYDIIEPAIAAVPIYDTESGQMTYRAEVEPKHTARVKADPSPKTGVDESVVLYMTGGMLCISGAVLLALAGRRKKCMGQMNGEKNNETEK